MSFRVQVLAAVSAAVCASALLAQAPRRGRAIAAGSNARGELAGSTPVADSYAGEAIVVEQMDSMYRYHADGTGTKLETEVTRAKTEAAVRSLGALSFPYAAGSQRLEIVYVRVRKPDGTVVETPATEAQEQPSPLTVAAPLYSDLHLLQIPVRGLRVGDALEYQVRTVFTKAEAKGQFWGEEHFGRGVAVLERTIELRVPLATYVGVSSPNDPAQVSQDGDERVYRWEGSKPDLSPRPKPGEGGNEARQRGTEDAASTQPVAWTTFHNWAEVGNWYRELAFDRSAPTPALTAKANEIVYGLRTPEAKVRALYSYVSSQVRSIDVPLGVGRYQPHPAAEVLANQYGDSKDKHTLLAALLRAEHVPVSTVLIGAGIELNEAVPAPGWFNNEITLVKDGPGGGQGLEPGGGLWLDTMAEVAPFQMLSASLRDKLALVIPAAGEPALRRTPPEPPFPAYTHFEAAGTLSAEGDLKAHVDMSMRGDDELIYREGLRAAGPAHWDRLTEYFARSEGFSGESSNTVAEAPERTDRPLHVGYDYTNKLYGDWENFRILPLEPRLILPLSDRKTPPLNDLPLGGKRTETAVSKITLPAGFSADVPPASHVHSEFATLDRAFRLEMTGEGQTLVAERTLVIKEDKLRAGQWADYRKFLDEAYNTEPWVQLTRMRAGGVSGHHPPAAGESNPGAAASVRQAGELIEERKWAEAAEKLDEAKAVNPRQALLWSEYGYIAVKGGKFAEATDDYHHELAQHPEESAVSRALAGVQVSQGDTSAAVQTLQAALGVDSKDERTWLLLSRVQSQGDGRMAEATLRAGLRELPDSVGIKLALGDALVKEGKADEAAGLLTTVATESQDPSQLNDAAYLLGDTSHNVPVAEAASRRSIYALNAASARGENGVGGLPALARSRLLIACWDTYGWILFRKGSPSEAEPWLRAAWVDGSGALPGQHLARLLERQGRTAEAARIQRLANQAGTVGFAAKDGLLHRTSVATEAGSGAGHVDAIVSRVAMQDGRTFSMPYGGNIDGWAIFEMDYALRSGTIAHFVRGEQGLAAMGDALEHLDAHMLIPPGSVAHLLLRGVLSCRGGKVCTFVLLLPGEAADDAGR